jgi:hypothetical protein
LESGRDITLERQAASSAIWGTDELNLPPAIDANVATLRRCPILPAKLANFGIEEARKHFQPILTSQICHFI